MRGRSHSPIASSSATWWISSKHSPSSARGSTAIEALRVQSSPKTAQTCSISALNTERYENRLSRALASVINLLDPEVIVLGGGLSGIARLYEAVPRLLPAHVFGSEAVTAVLPPRHGDSSGVRGAAWLWREDELDLALRRPEP